MISFILSKLEFYDTDLSKELVLLILRHCRLQPGQQCLNAGKWNAT